MSKRKKEYIDIFATLFLPYLVLIVILLIMGGVLYLQSLKIAEEQIRQKNEFLLEEVQESLSSLIMGSGKLFSHLNYVLSSFNLSVDTEGMSRQELSTKLYGLQVEKNLVPPEIFHDYILDYYILFETPAVILNSAVSLPLDSYLKFNLKLSQKKSDEVYSTFFNKNFNRGHLVETLSLLDHPVNPIPEVLTSQLGMIWNFGGMYSGQKGVIIIYIDEKALLRSLEKLNLTHGGTVLVLNESGKIVLNTVQGKAFKEIGEGGFVSEENLEKLRESKQWFITETGRPGHPFRYVTIQSRAFLRDQTKRMRYTMIFIISGLILIGVLFSLIMAYMNSKPVNELLMDFQEKLNLDNVHYTKINMVGGLFSAVNLSHRKMYLSLQDQTRLLELTVFDKLLNGYPIRDEVHREVIENSLNINADSFTVIIIHRAINPVISHIDDIGSTTLWKSYIREYLEMQTQIPGIHMTDRSPEEIVLICHDDKESEWRVDKLADNLYERVTREHNVEVNIAIGGSVETTEDIHQSYEQATMMMDEENRELSIGIRKFKKREFPSLSIHFPTDIDQKLLNCVISGDEITLKALFEDLYRNNLIKSQISFPFVRILLHSMTGNLVRISQKIRIDNREIQSDIEGLATEEITIENYKDYFHKLSSLYIRITELRQSIQIDRKTKKVQDLCQYMDENFNNALLSADLVGSNLGISGNYVYKLFKEYYGTSFHQYIEQIRMEYAKKMLVESNKKSIKEIALASGYTSINTFYKAFKKNFGISAGEYRKARGNLQGE